MNVFERVIYLLQAEMNRPSSYGLYHILCLVITFVVIFFLSINKSNNKERKLKIILLVYGILALLLEFFKQIVWSMNYDINTSIVTWDYNWYAFPFQLCTTPIFASLICAFLKKCKVRDYLLAYIAFFTILGSISTAIYPESCFVRTILVNIHTMYLHLGSLILSIYLLISGEVKLNFKSLLSGYTIFIIFVIIAQILNISIYNSGILKGETFNMFYISPYFISGLPIYDVLQENLPYPIYLLIYLTSIFLGGYIIFIISYIINKKNLKKQESTTQIT